MKKIVALLLMSVMMLALTGCGGSDKKDEKAAGSDKKVVLKLSHVFSPDEQLYKSMELVAERIKKKTNGRVVKTSWLATRMVWSRLLTVPTLFL